MPDVFRLFID